MDCLKDKRACTSYRIMVSVEQVERYKKVIAQHCVDTHELLHEFSGCYNPSAL